MARITAKANCSDGTEMTVNLSTKKVTLNIAGNLSAGAANGITGAALFGALSDLWNSGATHNQYRMPFAMADGPIKTMLEFRQGWEFFSTASAALLRSCGFAYIDTSDVTQEEWLCLVQGGTLADAADQPYYLLDGDAAKTNFGVADAFNECIQVYDNGVIDRRTALEIYAREAGKTYGYYDLVTTQALTALTYRSYLIPMTTVTDAGIVTTSPSGSPYDSMTLTLGATTHTINGVSRDFAVGEIDANGGTVQQCYDWYQNELLATGTIDVGATEVGNIYAEATLSFSGGVITTSQGLTIKNIAAADASNIIHVDDLGVSRQVTVTATVGGSGMPTTGADIRLQVTNVAALTASAWAATTAYSLGDKVLRSTGLGTESTAGLYMVCTTAGTSNDTEPTWDTTVGNTTADTNGSGAGDVVWTTYAILFYDADPAGATVALNYTNGEEFSAGDAFRVRFAELDGATSFSLYDTSGIAAASGFSFVVAVVADSPYAINAVDGSAVTMFSADYVNDEIDLAADADYAGTQLWAFYCYALTTTGGMHQFWGGATAIDPANYRINTAVVNLYLDETIGAFVKQTDSSRIFRDDDVRPAKDPTTGGYGIEVNWRNPVYGYDAGGGGFTAGDRAAAVTAAASSAAAATDAGLARQIVQNRNETDDETSKQKIYNDAGSAVLLEAPLWADDEGTEAWTAAEGQTIKRRDALASP